MFSLNRLLNSLLIRTLLPAEQNATTVKLVLVVLLVPVLGAMPISPPFVYRSLPKLQ